jgi:PKHD-type hydroxylase
MVLEIPNVVDRETVDRLMTMIAGGSFVPGSRTAAGAAARVKNNEQLDVHSEPAQQAGTLLIDTLRANPVFEAATLPARIVAPRFSRCGPGMGYGDHLDAPLMSDLPPIRTDIAVTVFLADAANYDGGELTIHTDYGPHRFKGSAGHCVVYPADMVHRVEPVTRGERIVSFFWIQSLVRDPERRRILFDLAEAVECIDGGADPRMNLETLRRCHANLIRMWANA